ncbi:hypothetical protein HDE_12673 [Halotydeus destructor]|nr:hypothetical protein HDE_12673 [Halotydeus destructor]
MENSFMSMKEHEKIFSLKYVPLEERLALEGVSKEMAAITASLWDQQKILVMEGQSGHVAKRPSCLNHSHRAAEPDHIRVSRQNPLGKIKAILQRATGLRALYLEIPDDYQLYDSQFSCSSSSSSSSSACDMLVDGDSSDRKSFNAPVLLNFAELCPRLEHFGTSNFMLLEMMTSSYPRTLTCFAYTGASVVGSDRVVTRLKQLLGSLDSLKHISYFSRMNGELFDTILKVKTIEELGLPAILRPGFKNDATVRYGVFNPFLHPYQDTEKEIEENSEKIVNAFKNLKSVDIKWLSAKYLRHYDNLESLCIPQDWTLEDIQMIMISKGEKLRSVKALNIDTTCLTVILNSCLDLETLDIVLKPRGFLPMILLEKVKNMKHFRCVTDEVYGDREYFSFPKKLRNIELGSRDCRISPSIIDSLIEYALWHPKRTIVIKLYLNGRPGFYDWPSNLKITQDIKVVRRANDQ